MVGRLSTRRELVLSVPRPRLLIAARGHLLFVRGSLAQFVEIDKQPGSVSNPMDSDLTKRIARESQTLGRALLILRGRAGMAQQDVAARAGTNAAALSHAEKGQRDFRWSTIARVLDALGADLHDFAKAMAEAEKDDPAPKR